MNKVLLAVRKYW